MHNSNDRRDTAFFILKPRTIEDLKAVHPASQRKTFNIVKAVELKAIDYENFIWDFGVEREFIEKNSQLCRVDETGIHHCLLIKQRDKAEGILVMPDGSGKPKYVALYCINPTDTQPTEV